MNFKNYSMMMFLIIGVVMSSCQKDKQEDIKSIAAQTRKADYPIHDLIVQRWSPRAMSGEEISQDDLLALFEAARWAPSSYNNQPWRFIYVTKHDDAWQKMFDLMVPFNQSWARNASVLILVLSYNYFENNGKPSPTHTFETGAAVENLALEGFRRGLVVHGMEGFDYKRARSEFDIPDDYTIEALYAVGKPAPAHVLPEDMQARNVPTQRKKASELISHSAFSAAWPRVKK